jgi:3-hydroxypropanoate dehydrogenase
MSTPLNNIALEKTFTQARTFSKFSDHAVTDDTLHALYELAKWGPTSMNTQPARLVFVRSAEAKAQLLPALAPGNADKTMAAPVCVIVAMDSRFYEHLPEQFPAMNAKPMFEGNAGLAESTAFRNSSLQAAYLIVAARQLGLDCGPMSGFDASKVDAAFFPDGRFKTNLLINLGYGDASGNYPRGPRLPFETVARIA